MAKTFDQYMAESGRQSELDRLRATGGYNAAKSQYESGSGGYGSGLQMLDDNTKRYYDDLVSMAEKDLDFVLERLDKEHEIALGNNDSARAQFIESVADKVEAKMGRIPYDYKVARERQERNTNQALSRLAADARVLRERIDRDAELTREQQMGNLNARGLINGPRDQVTGLGGREISRVEDQIADRIAALDREISRNREDINTQNTDTLADLKTGARRDALDTQRAYSLNKQQEQTNFDRRKKEIERARKLESLSNLSGSFNFAA